MTLRESLAPLACSLGGLPTPAPVVHESHSPDARKPPLLDRVPEAARKRPYPRRTEDADVAWIRF